MCVGSAVLRAAGTDDGECGTRVRPQHRQPLAVSDADFTRFLADEVTPRFPDGLTVIDARGQWRDSARGVTVREPSKVLQLVFDNGDAQKRADLGVIAEAYKTRFRQQSVMTVVRSACVGF